METKSGHRGRKILNCLLDKRETKKMKGLAEAGEQRGKWKDFKAREGETIETERGWRGLVMGERWQDIETSECQGEESETWRWRMMRKKLRMRW